MSEKMTDEAKKALAKAYGILVERDKQMVAAGLLPPPGTDMNEQQKALLAECLEIKRRQKK